MDLLYLGIVVFLFLLAIFDLVVGVSNDAVNFLNSAIGSKVAKFKTIMIVATIGIFCGAAFSDGMMTIARSGIMNPQYFYFNEVMIIFLAVMIADVVLLDVFNTLGYPTSTTVSLVFELLGGTFALAMIKTMNDDSLVFGQLLNTDKALQVIFGIFLSVAIAFFFGAIVQWLTRTIFRFNYKINLKYKIGLFGGVALTALCYFILIKGMKHSAFMTPEARTFIGDYTWQIVGACFVVFTVLMQILHYFKVNIFKIIVLTGTFALAMAFAGNDLVNFVGVPLAGFASFQDFTQNAAGASADTWLMGSLAGEAHTNLWFLVGAGLVMVISLVTSPKARNVVKTSLDLSRQDDGDEMFGSSSLARSLVRVNQQMSQRLISAMPSGARTWLGKRFRQDEAILPDGAAFDAVRASVNLVLAGLLIAFGTSLKLPLSTTYVAFMVAMGTSLADKAWGRETAVFRITGVLSVIGGWFITAGVAFVLCFGIALAIYYGGMIVAGIFIIAAIGLIIRSHVVFKNGKTKETDQSVITSISTMPIEEQEAAFTNRLMQTLIDNLQFVSHAYQKSFTSFTKEDLRALRKCSREQMRAREALKKSRSIYILLLRTMENTWVYEKTTWFHLSMNSSAQLLYSLKRAMDPMVEHVDNNFHPMPKEWVEEYQPHIANLVNVIQRIEYILKTQNFEEYDNVRRSCQETYTGLAELRLKHLARIQQTKKGSMRVQTLYLNVIQEAQELTNNLKYVLRYTRKYID